MSAWYIFSAIGFYPVNPVSREYIVGTCVFVQSSILNTHPLPITHISSLPRPFFDKVTIDLPGSPRPLVISSPGASNKPYIRSLKVDGVQVKGPLLTHDQIVHGGLIEFVMSNTPEEWGSSTIYVGGEGKGAERVHRRHPHVEL